MRIFKNRNEIKISKISMLSCLALSIFLATSCGERLEDTKHPLFVKAKKHAEQHEYENAAKTFNEYLQINPASYKTHYELAVLYDDQLDDPLYSIYHYKRYIELAPESQDRENAKLWLENSEKKYFEKLSRKYSSESDMKKEIEFLKARENEILSSLDRLEKENKYLKSASKTVAQTTAEQPLPNEKIQTADPLAPEPIVQRAQTTKTTTAKPEKTYRVQQGDTLSKIAKKFYGDTKYFNLILEANKTKLKSPSDLKFGDEIIIPNLPQKKSP